MKKMAHMPSQINRHNYRILNLEKVITRFYNGKGNNRTGGDSVDIRNLGF